MNMQALRQSSMGLMLALCATLAMPVLADDSKPRPPAEDDGKNCRSSAPTALCPGSPAALMAATAAVEMALEAAADHRFAEAFAQFRMAAEQGHGQAQRSAGLMALYGDRLYGPEVMRDRAEAMKWLKRAAAQGCSVSGYMLKHLARNVGEPPLALAALAISGR